MGNQTFFVATCHGCSRRNQLEIRLLGHKVECNFCGRLFHARGPDSDSAALEDPVHYWIEFTDHEFAAFDPLVVDSRDISRTPR